MNQAKTELAEHNNAWKGRGNLSNLVTELQRQKDSKLDFVSDVRNFNIQSNGSLLLAPNGAAAGEWLPDGPIAFNPKAVRQLAEKCDPAIPAKFFDAMLKDRRELLADLVNGLHLAAPAKRLVRCLDGKVRAWLSDTYRVIDSLDAAFTCMDVAQRNGGQVLEANLSDTAMRIKFTSQAVWDVIDITQRSGPQGGWFAGAIGNKELQGKQVLGATIKGELPGGPGTIHPVITVSNSETGHGGFNVRLGILMGICFNVATLEDVVSQIHLGGERQEGIYSAETVAADSKAIMLKARDAVAAAFNTEKFKALVAKAKQAQTDIITTPGQAVDAVIEATDINGEHREALLAYFLRDYDQTRFGLAQAVSRLAQDVTDPDAADTMERVAGKLIADKNLVTA